VVRATDVEEANRLVSRLGGCGTRLRSMTQVKPRLEEIYVERLEGRQERGRRDGA